MKNWYFYNVTLYSFVTDIRSPIEKSSLYEIGRDISLTFSGHFSIPKTVLLTIRFYKIMTFSQSLSSKGTVVNSIIFLISMLLKQCFDVICKENLCNRENEGSTKEIEILPL